MKGCLYAPEYGRRQICAVETDIIERNVVSLTGAAGLFGLSEKYPILLDKYELVGPKAEDLRPCLADGPRTVYIEGWDGGFSFDAHSGDSTFHVTNFVLVD